jgi:hypothetical protein
MRPAPGERSPAGEPQGARSLVERAGLAAAAILFAVLFGGMAVAAWSEGEVFLAVMAGIGALMTVWAAAGSLVRRP